jgi:hypothetical protein
MQQAERAERARAARIDTPSPISSSSSLSLSPEPITPSRVREDQCAARDSICVVCVRSLAVRKGDGVCRDYPTGDRCLRCRKQYKPCVLVEGKLAKVAMALAEEEQEMGRDSAGAVRLRRKLNEVLRAADAALVAGAGLGLWGWLLVVVVVLLAALVAYLLAALGVLVIVTGPCLL